MAHPGRIAAARATNKKLAAKKDQLAAARASRVPVLHPETGALYLSSRDRTRHYMKLKLRGRSNMILPSYEDRG